MFGAGLSFAIKLVDFGLNYFKASEETKRAFYGFVEQAIEDQNLTVNVTKNIEKQIEDLKEHTDFNGERS